MRASRPDPYHDLRFREYQLAWQAPFSRRRKRYGPRVAQHAQHYISVLRAMRRRLAAGGKPSLSDFPSFGHARCENFLDKRKFKKLRPAVDRGETTRSLARRGFFGSLKDYYTYHFR